METFWTLARVVVSLAVVLGLVWALGRAARRRTLGGGPQAEVAVIGRQVLSRSASVAVVRVGGQAMVLGVTDSSVTLLGSVDPEDLAAPPRGLTQEPEQPAAAPARAEPAFEHVMATIEAHPDRSDRPEQALTRAELRARSAPGPHAAPTGPSAPTPAPSVLAGSALSPATWTRAVGVLRERSARR